MILCSLSSMPRWSTQAQSTSSQSYSYVDTERVCRIITEYFTISTTTPPEVIKEILISRIGKDEYEFRYQAINRFFQEMIIVRECLNRPSIRESIEMQLDLLSHFHVLKQGHEKVPSSPNIRYHLFDNLKSDRKCLIKIGACELLTEESQKCLKLLDDYKIKQKKESGTYEFQPYEDCKKIRSSCA